MLAVSATGKLRKQTQEDVLQSSKLWIQTQEGCFTIK